MSYSKGRKLSKNTRVMLKRRAPNFKRDSHWSGTTQALERITTKD